MAILLLFTFISGLVTILAPCIWPLLPLVLSASATGGKKKPLGITTGILVSFGLLTLSISYLVRIFSFDPEVIRYVAVFIIGLMGISLLVPRIGALLESYISRVSGKLGGFASKQGEGFGGGFFVGLALGIVWTPCAGPILATIITLASTRAVSLEVILMMTVYIIGVGIPLFLFALFGQRLFGANRALAKHTGRIHQLFGVVMILMAIAIYTGYDRTLQANLLDAIPSYSQFLNKLEGNKAVEEQLDRLRNPQEEEMIKEKEGKAVDPMGGTSQKYPRAPEFTGIETWLNVDEPLTMEELRGTVVLIDFWTYTCINCIRTLPHVTAWHETYKNDGFTVIGVHTPEFEFEKKTENVLQAIVQYNITYPVAQDNDYQTWRAYDNHYWPAHYLIDVEGNIRYTHFGEGKYEETEEMIRKLLMERSDSISEEAPDMPDETPRFNQTPETYVGLGRMQYYVGTTTPKQGQNSFPTDTTVSQVNRFTFGGDWLLSEEYAQSGENAELTIRFNANDVFLVITPAQEGDRARVVLDEKLIGEDQSGKDVSDGIVTLDTDRLYDLVDLRGNRGEHTLQLEFLSPGTQVFAFTFG
ncbi:cytochrome c biogenesis protein DipZ [Candidatus Roizmanbacteria bacterium]|nr:cytochrome c biogenesis protein DipZ [Candidatus Roizmanbacteria bacterium]